jgi:very-short-patch-repair endonuclease
MIWTEEKKRKASEKRKQTMLNKYGVESMFKSDRFKEKSKQTMLRKYGVDHNWKSKEIRDRMKKTLLERYGVDNPTKLKSIQEKQKQTCLQKYGTREILSNKNIREQIKQTCLAKYDGVAPACSEEVYIKQKQTCLEKYGVNNPAKIKHVILAKKAAIQKKRIKIYNNFIARFKNVKPLFSVDEFEGCGPKIYKWLKISLNEEFTAAYWGYEPMGKFQNTYIEQFIMNLLKKNSIDYELKNRNVIKPYELDFYLPKFNLAIETNGIFYHSTQCIDDNAYHSTKFKMCKEKGIRLIQIFEDEIVRIPKIVSSRLKHILQLCKYKIYARNCQIQQISSSQKDIFLDKYHLQGTCQSKINLGAFYKNRLVAVMTFSSFNKNRVPTKNNPSQWELTRFAGLSNFTIIGIAGKLFQYFLRNYNQTKLPVISFSDLCWGEGNVYNKLGFKLDNYTLPGYFYSKNNCRYHRFGFRKSMLSKKLENFDSNKSEFENMDINGYFRIYNAGYAKYTFSD